MNDLEELSRAAVAGVDDPPSLAWLRHRATQRRRRRWAIAAAALVVLVPAAFAVQSSDTERNQVTTADDPDGANDVLTEPTTTTITSTNGNQSDDPAVGATVEPLPGAPEIDESNGAPAIVWTGEEFVIWGGGESLAVAYRPEDEETRPIATAPISSRRDPAGVFTGDAVYFVGGVGADGARSDGAAYFPGIDEWDPIPEPPIPGGAPLAEAWTGAEVLVFGQIDRNGTDEDLVRGAAYNPATLSWRRIADAPVAINFGNGVWTGSELVVIGSHLDDNNASSMETTVMAYDPAADSWRLLPPPGLSPQAMWLESDGDGGLYAWDYLLDAVTLSSSTGQWDALPSIPLDARECYSRGASSPAQILMTYCADGAVLDRSTLTWSTLAIPNTQIPPIPTDAGIVFFSPGGASILEE
jgi:hypothetical protein